MLNSFSACSCFDESGPLLRGEEGERQKGDHPAARPQYAGKTRGHSAVQLPSVELQRRRRAAHSVLRRDAP